MANMTMKQHKYIKNLIGNMSSHGTALEVYAQNALKLQFSGLRGISTKQASEFIALIKRHSSLFDLLVEIQVNGLYAKLFTCKNGQLLQCASVIKATFDELDTLPDYIELDDDSEAAFFHHIIKTVAGDKDYLYD